MSESTSASRRRFLSKAAGCMLSASFGFPALLSSQSRRRRRPNFVIFYTDDQGYGDLGCFGGSDLKTPNIDRLAEGGARLTNWYSNSPVCSPSRAALLTGRFPRRAGVPHILGASNLKDPTPYKEGLPASEITLAESLKALGYRTGVFGKWHLGSSTQSRPTSQGFENFYGFMAGCIDFYSHIFYWGQAGGVFPFHDLWKNETEQWQDGQYMTHIITREAKKFIRENRDTPFLLYVPYNAPHYPMHAPQEYIDRFPKLEWTRRVFAAMVAAVDDSVGEIMEEIRQTGLEEDTMTFYQSDNGSTTEARCFLDGAEGLYNGGSNGGLKGYKASLFEGGIRMPALMNWPGRIPSGQVIDEPGIAMDIFPTFVKLAGGNVPTDRKIDGRDVFPMVASSAPSPHESLYWEYGKQQAVRQGDWKLVLNGKLDFSRQEPESVFLTNLENDRNETRNVASSHKDKVKELRRLIDSYKADIDRDT